MKRGRELLAKKYRFTWNKKKTRESLQQGCHLMIWSDNDVANDFTIKKHEDGEQFYPEAFLKCGIEMYREYQRQLWEPELSPLPEDDEFFQEYHAHTYGPIGIFLMDIRGNRITGDGKLQSERPVVSQKQWKDLGKHFSCMLKTCEVIQLFSDEFFEKEELKVIIIASEVPFIGDDPETIQEKAEQTDFLKDHWPYNKEELEQVLDRCFNWKKEDEENREVILVGGDIHCGAETRINDDENDVKIRYMLSFTYLDYL